MQLFANKNLGRAKTEQMGKGKSDNNRITKAGESQKTRVYHIEFPELTYWFFL